jgi:hypothetical protein
LSASGAISLTAANSGAKISGFQKLGVTAGVTGTIDMSTLPSDINALHVIGAGSISFTKVAANTPLSIDVAHTATSYKLASTGGSSKSVSVNLGTSTSDTVNFGTVELIDANGNGIGTVNLVSNGVNITAGDAIPNTNTAILTNAGLTNLNVSGTQGLTLTSQTIGSAITGLSINNTNTGSAGLVISSLVASGADNLSFAGTGKTTITNLFDGSIGNVSLTNTGSQEVTVGNLYSSTSGTTAAVFTDLTLSGNIALTATTSATGAVNINGATDNSRVDLTFTDTGTGVKTVTLGNGNNEIDLALTSGANVVKTGSGLDLITGGTGADSIDAGAGDDIIYGLAGTDFINGGEGDDYLIGDTTGNSAATDTLIGGNGADYLRGSDISSALAEGARNDADLIFAGTQTSLVNSIYVEGTEVAGSKLNTSFSTVYSPLSTQYAAFVGANIVEGRSGNDILVASSEKDVFLYKTFANTALTANSVTASTILGTDVIHSFRVGEDYIAPVMDISGGDYTFVSGVNGQHSASQVYLKASTAGWSVSQSNGTVTLSFDSNGGGLSTLNAGGTATQGDFTITLVGVLGFDANTTVDNFFFSSTAA